MFLHRGSAETADPWEAWALWLHKPSSTFSSKEAPWSGFHCPPHPRQSGPLTCAGRHSQLPAVHRTAERGHRRGAGPAVRSRQPGGVGKALLPACGRPQTCPGPKAPRKARWGSVVKRFRSTRTVGARTAKDTRAGGAGVGMYPKCKKEEKRDSPFEAGPAIREENAACVHLLGPDHSADSSLYPAGAWGLEPGPERCRPPRPVAKVAGEFRKPFPPQRVPVPQLHRVTLRATGCVRIPPPRAVLGCGGCRGRWRPGPWPRKACFLFLRPRDACPRPRRPLETHHRILLWASSLPGTEDPGPGKKVRGSLTFSAGYRIPPPAPLQKLWERGAGRALSLPTQGPPGAADSLPRVCGRDSRAALHPPRPGTAPPLPGPRPPSSRKVSAWKPVGGARRPFGLGFMLWPREGRRAPGREPGRREAHFALALSGK